MNERDDSPVPIRELLGEVGGRMGLHSAVETGMVWGRWTEIVGSAVAAHAEPSSLKAGVLRVRTDSPAWATEIAYLRDQIKDSVNHTVGAKLVREVRVWTGPGPSRTRGKERFSDSPRGRIEEPPPVPAPDPARAVERARRAWTRRGRPARAPDQGGPSGAAEKLDPG